jgi:hypothetical protein
MSRKAAKQVEKAVEDPAALFWGKMWNLDMKISRRG